MLASESPYVDNVKLDPASETKSNCDSGPLSSGTTYFPPVHSIQAVRHVAVRPITFQYGDITLTTSPNICQDGDTVY